MYAAFPTRSCGGYIDLPVSYDTISLVHGLERGGGQFLGWMSFQDTWFSPRMERRRIAGLIGRWGKKPRVIAADWPRCGRFGNIRRESINRRYLQVDRWRKRQLIRETDA